MSQPNDNQYSSGATENFVQTACLLGLPMQVITMADAVSVIEAAIDQGN